MITIHYSDPLLTYCTAEQHPLTRFLSFKFHSALKSVFIETPDRNNIT